MHSAEMNEQLDRLAIARLMEGLGITTLGDDSECRGYLNEISTEQFLGGIALVSAQARGIDLDQGSSTSSPRVAVFEGANSPDRTTGIKYIPPQRAIGEQALDRSLEVAKRLPQLRAAGALLRLMISLAHIRPDGNGAASRFYHKLLTEGYDGTPAAAAQYRAILASQGGPRRGYREVPWQAAFATYQAASISDRDHLPYIPDGYTRIAWQGDNRHRFPTMLSGAGLYFVENNFATAFDLDFMATTGRDTQSYIVERWPWLRSRRYIDTEKLLLDVPPEESDIAYAIGDNHKRLYLGAVADQFATGHHPAFSNVNLAQE